MRTFVAQLAYDLRRHATRPIQIMMGILLILIFGGLGGMGYYFYSTESRHEQHIVALLKELESARLTQAELQQRTKAERARMAEVMMTRQTEMNRLMAIVEEQHQQGRRVSPEDVQKIQRRLKGLEAERNSVRTLIARYGPSVCFLYGAYGFLDKNQSTGIPNTLIEYTGTGFLVDDKGLMVTNRHLVEPWAMDPSGAEIMKSGFQPVLITLLAYFPGHPRPFEVKVVAKSSEGDTALGRLSPIPQEIRFIPLPSPTPKGIVGETVPERYHLPMIFQRPSLRMGVDVQESTPAA